MKSQNFDEYEEPREEPRERGKGFIRHWRSSSPVWKLIGVLLLSQFLLIPLGMIRSQIDERGDYQQQVTNEIADEVAEAQTITGPLLAIHYRIKTPEKRCHDKETGKIVICPEQIRAQTVFMPAKTLAIKGQSKVEARYRGIYQVRLFHLDLDVDGFFEAFANILPVPDGDKIIDANAAILFGLSDLRGMNIDPDVRVDGRTMHFTTPKGDRFSKILPGNRLEIDLGTWTPGKERKIEFSFPLKLTGTTALSIAPTAENNVIQLASDWPHPNFRGRFLPRERQINNQGFSAKWEISQLARNLNNTLREHSDEVLRVAFIDPINVYLQSERAVKYGSLFIMLTFGAFFLGEILRRRPMHIVQYMLVGLALAIFFLLLVALSEQFSFAQAYLVASFGCIGLIVFYLAAVLGSWRMGGAFGIGLASLYGMLYVILQLEDKALLMGSLLLFVALSAAMLITRKLDWYGLTQAGKKNAPEERFRDRQARESAATQVAREPSGSSTGE